MKLISTFAAIASLALPHAMAAETSCTEIQLQTRKAVETAPDKLLETVSHTVAASPSCSCEIVKAAIEGSQADAKTVAAIVETAITEAPEQLRLIAQCAVAMAPDALAEVQAVLARLDPNKVGAGDSAKSSKSAEATGSTEEVATTPNPLDFPGGGPVGSTSEEPDGPTLFPVIIPIVPVYIGPPQVTDVNP